MVHLQSRELATGQTRCTESVLMICCVCVRQLCLNAWMQIGVFYNKSLHTWVIGPVVLINRIVGKCVLITNSFEIWQIGCTEAIIKCTIKSFKMVQYTSLDSFKICSQKVKKKMVIGAQKRLAQYGIVVCHKCFLIGGYSAYLQIVSVVAEIMVVYIGFREASVKFILEFIVEIATAFIEKMI
ncbi:MAG: hypothetical protein EBS53_15285 [Bacteroidetes bacterium]|nr:hypothetical protein [Bacteroidota bacterium]